MNIDISTLTTTKGVNSTQKSQNNNSSENFADELKELRKIDDIPETDVKNEDKEIAEQPEIKAQQETNIKQEENSIGLNNAIEGLNTVLKELNQPDDKEPNLLKKDELLTDNDSEDVALINNDFNIQDNKDKLPQMSLNMSFGGDGEPFASFMNNESELEKKDKLSNNAKDLAEEAEILSTMSENLAMVNKTVQSIEPIKTVDSVKSTESLKSIEPDEKTVIRNDGIKKIDTSTNIVTETVVKYDAVIMNEADVEVFANLVENGFVDMNSTTSQGIEKSIGVSKTLADMLAKSMEDNKPVRIEFDNGISIIIKISRDGKISADFLPSTQIAEAYLKENLPILRQRFDNQNIEYDELNQRERRERNRDNDQKRDRKHE